MVCQRKKARVDLLSDCVVRARTTPSSPSLDRSRLDGRHCHGCCNLTFVTEFVLWHIFPGSSRRLTGLGAGVQICGKSIWDWCRHGKRERTSVKSLIQYLVRRNNLIQTEGTKWRLLAALVLSISICWSLRTKVEGLRRGPNNSASAASCVPACGQSLKQVHGIWPASTFAPLDNAWLEYGFPPRCSFGLSSKRSPTVWRCTPTSLTNFAGAERS
ncbi:hypothetical protein B0T16DRAFT_131482 [Cercophora newfieldiana]|uniref:Uncharacterized protein n=1 Tax=Cercophora newfieldiana TaxID=92897 RepID=A0AA39YB97_9PEZI|nr:hypothetical protein B0T16DRAFT_131482 [Cercophora newfieldiana]